jgi:UDP-GlcNAc:undecaprenyl-phosphate GlcNAc-1-phosphate transferase
MPLFVKLLFYFLGTMGFTLLMVFLLLGFAKSLGIRSKNDISVRWSNTSKPSLGGIAIFSSVFMAIIIYLISHPTENVFGNQRFLLFFLGISLAFFMGLADDAFNTQPLIKLVTQVICGLSVVASDLLIPATSNYWIDATLTIVWVIGLMNSLNMLDNMDGITASVAISILLMLLAFGLLFSSSTVDIHTFIMIGLVGSLSGFLMVNAPPSKLFMGDSGSQLIGYTIAFSSIYYLWYNEPSHPPFWVTFYVALLILAIPFIDTFTVSFNRIKQGKSPAKGGKDHTTHHLVYLGFTERQTFLFVAITSMILGASGLLVFYLYTLNLHYFSLLPVLLFFPIFYFLFKNTHEFKAPKDKNNRLD